MVEWLIKQHHNISPAKQTTLLHSSSNHNTIADIMKTATALALVSAVAGAAIEPRQTLATEFDVTDFSASCQPHSVLCL